MKKIIRFLQAFPESEQEFERQLNIITLQFRMPELEYRFIQEHTCKRLFLFRISTLLQIAINIGYTLNSIIIYASALNIIYRSLFIVWLLFTLIIQRIFTKHEHIYTNFLIYISSVLNVLLFANFTINIYNSQASVQAVAQFALVAGLSQALFAMSFLFTQSNYLMQSLTLFTYFFILLGVFNAFENYKLWAHYLLMIFTSYIFRSKERATRIEFLKINKSHLNLEACKRIYDETVPTSIIIIEQSAENDFLNSLQSREKEQFTEESKPLHILYFNKSASLHFQSIEENQILSKLFEIQIVQNESNINNKLINERLVDQIPKIRFDYQSQQKFTPTHKLDYDIINSQTILTCKRQINSNKSYYYDVKPVSCLWEGKQCVMLILNETTDRALRIKQLQELDQYKDNLLATVSHDLKTPLNGLLIIVNVIKSMIQNKTQLFEKDIEEIRNNLDDMIGNSQILFTMINDLIDYSQLKLKGLRLNFTQFILTNCVEKIKTMLRRQIELKKLTFTVIGLEQQIVMYSDEVRLTQILFNLINNAIKFTFQGSITLKIKLFTEKNFKLIQFQVIDTGIGIPHHIQSMLFKAYSTHNLGNCNNQGVGLGLVISKKMVGLLGPREYIEMESQEGTGSIFGFQIYQNAFYKNAKGVDIPTLDHDPMGKIPAIPVKQNSYKKYPSLSEVPKAVVQPIKILIVDDAPFNIYALKSLISQVVSFREVDEALDGLQALKRVEEKTYDIIFMDLLMPGMDGFQSTEEIRKLEKQTQNKQKAHIFILSGLRGLSDQQKSKEAGADDFLEKPLKIKDLQQMLHKYNYI